MSFKFTDETRVVRAPLAPGRRFARLPVPLLPVTSNAGSVRHFSGESQRGSRRCAGPLLRARRNHTRVQRTQSGVGSHCCTVLLLQMVIAQLRDLSDAVAALSSREIRLLFEAWWTRWSSVFSIVLSNTSQLSASLGALPLLNPPWEPLDVDCETSVKIAVRELARFGRTNVDNPPPDWTLVSEIALISAELVQTLLSARRSCNYRHAMDAVVSMLSRTVSAVVGATSDAVLLIDVDPSLTTPLFCERAEIAWFERSIRAVLRREELDVLASERVVLEPAVIALLAVDADAFSR
ncbi:MAG: hypothetical protein JNK05_41430 [Myxococcales bacterium]|nr:hypothetical protein [Myxococcales bacterium]